MKSQGVILCGRHVAIASPVASAFKLILMYSLLRVNAPLIQYKQIDRIPQVVYSFWQYLMFWQYSLAAAAVSIKSKEKVIQA